MNIPSTNSVNGSTATTLTTGNVAKDTSDMFMTLLVTQLKSQDPISPMDPTQFVGQLVQFNSLNELVKIRGLLEPQTQQSSATTSSVQSTAPTGGQ